MLRRDAAVDCLCIRAKTWHPQGFILSWPNCHILKIPHAWVRLRLLREYLPNAEYGQVYSSGAMFNAPLLHSSTH
jgi:hypothetical protein